MSKEYSIIKADHKKDFEGQYGSMRVYALELEETPQGSGIINHVELVQKPTTAPPAAGETVSGDITPNRNPDFPDKFKKEFKEGGFSGGGGSKGGGTFKPRDPSEIAGARHAHNLLVAAHSFTPLQPGAIPKEIQARLDDLEAFACVLDEKTAAISDAAKAAASKPETDVPF